jgi:hypothetical protein
MFPQNFLATAFGDCQQSPATISIPPHRLPITDGLLMQAREGKAAQDEALRELHPTLALGSLPGSVELISLELAGDG